MIKHYSHNIQNVIQRELFTAKKSIKICVAWFTNDLLFQPLILKLNMGVKVELILNKDEINLSDSNDVDFDQFVANGGYLHWNTTNKLLHHKFCIIDDQVVITGSYNWTNKAEYNYEDITVCTEDSDSINHYQKIFEKLSQEFPLLKSNQTPQTEKNITSNQEQTYTCSIKYTTTDGKIIDISRDKLPDGIKIISNTYRNGLGEIIFNKEITFMGCIFSHKKTLQSITIPDSVTTIGECAFLGFKMLTSITIGNGVNEIGRNAFSGCSNLTNITIPDSVMKIGDNAFSYNRLACVNVVILNLRNYCNGNPMSRILHMIQGRMHLYINNMEITDISIPYGVNEIGDDAFVGCKSLVSIAIPDSVTSIGACAFSGCSSLTSITIPDSVTTIRRCAFIDCRGLTSITIHDSVTSIEYDEDYGYDAFQNCRSLTRVNVIISDLTDYCDYYAKPMYVIPGSKYLYMNNEEIATLIIPDSVTAIGDSSFSECCNLTSVIISDGVTHIGDCAFFGCSGLTSITIPGSVTHIGDCAFSGCSGLTSITIPDSVTHIGHGVFDGCTSLTEFKGKFAADNGRCLIIDDVIIAYANASGSIYAIPDSVTEIGYGAFRDCTSLVSIAIPDSVTEIDYSSFAGCSSLANVNIPDSVTKIDQSAFSGCSGLASITIPDSVTEIGYGAFRDCTSLVSIAIPDSVTKIDQYAFSGCI